MKQNIREQVRDSNSAAASNVAVRIRNVTSRPALHCEAGYV